MNRRDFFKLVPGAALIAPFLLKEKKVDKNAFEICLESSGQVLDKEYLVFDLSQLKKNGNEYSGDVNWNIYEYGTIRGTKLNGEYGIITTDFASGPRCVKSGDTVSVNFNISF